MKQAILCILFLPLLFTSLQAQEAKPMTDIKAFEKALVEQASKIQSIESEFTQIKHLDIFDEEIISKGKFYYQEKNKICLDYKEPISYLILINNDKIKIVSDGKTNIMTLKSNEMFSKMQDMLTACMVGDLSRISSQYKIEYLDTDTNYLIKIAPNNKSVQNYITGIQIHIEKKDMSVSKLRLSEGNSDYTEYEFYNKKFNSLNDETLFRID